MKIKIKGIMWNVDFVDYIDNDLDINGQCIYRKRQIYIKKGLASEHRLEVIAHEIIHATLFECGLHAQSVDEELVTWIGFNFSGIDFNTFEIFKESKKDKR